MRYTDRAFYAGLACGTVVSMGMVGFLAFLAMRAQDEQYRRYSEYMQRSLNQEYYGKPSFEWERADEPEHVSAVGESEPSGVDV